MTSISHLLSGRPFLTRGRAILLASGCLLLLLPTLPASFDTGHPPQPTQIQELTSLPPGEAAAMVREALLASYQPSRGAISGSTTRPAYGQWLRLYQWFDLLSREDQSELARFLSYYLGVGKQDGQETNLYRLPGVAFGPDVRPLPDHTLKEIAGNTNTRERYQTLLLPPEFTWLDSSLNSYLGKELANQLAADGPFLEEFFSLLSPEDFSPAVLSNLAKLHAHNPEKFDEYRGLALALAVVFDQQPPAGWPHHQVAPEALPADNAQLTDRFDFWMESNEGGKLHTDLRRMPADLLRFVVDALVSPEELRWAQNQVRTPRSSFARVFSSIQYDHSRIKSQQFSWPHLSVYTLAEIQKRGGICVDQAYFAMLAGKARGIPTLFFVGQGADGGHAWFGFLRAENRWDLDCGRYENQNYAVGQAMDPQTWSEITDHDLKFLTAREQRAPAYQAGEKDLVIAEAFARADRPEDTLRAVKSAMEVSPQNPAAWQAKADMMEAKEYPLPQILAHHQAAARTFTGNPDAQSKFQLAVARTARKLGDDKMADELEARLIRQHRRLRSDISVNAAAAQLSAMIQAGQVDKAIQEFRGQTQRLGRTGGGNFFYEIVRPLTEHLIDDGHFTQASRALEIARRQLRPESGSILDQEFQKLEALAKEGGR